MKFILFLIFSLLSLFSLPSLANDEIIKQAYLSQKHDFQIQGSGHVIHILSDDTKGAKHQRFILRLNNKQTLLVAHNIDLAPRIPNLIKGDMVEFYGVYEYNSKGGEYTHVTSRYKINKPNCA
tara:strand:+ start:14559 stop:14927 length:369 start_codon:yes stop_codon:yes gene_type:complete